MKGLVYRSRFLTIFIFNIIKKFNLQGGKEHGVPILVSEVHLNQPADRCQNIFIGDAILTVNGIDLRSLKHIEAVQILSKEVFLIKI